MTKTKIMQEHLINKRKKIVSKSRIARIIDKELARFFWQAGDGRPKYHMVKWVDICLPKDRGGLVIPASHRMNVALMLRWVWRIM